MTTTGEPPPFVIDDPDTMVDPLPPIEDEATTEMVMDEGSVAALVALSGPALAALIAEGNALVEPIARRVARQIAFHVDVEELGSVGRAALVEAAKDYQPERAPFAPWVIHRLRWAMLDHLRREPNARAARRATALVVAELVGREGERAQPAPTEALPGAPPTAATSPRAKLAAALAARAAGLAVGLVVGGAAGAIGAEAVPDSSPDPERAVETRREAERLREAITTLPERQRALITRHYFGGERFDHIAESLGLSKSWASRLHAQAIAELGRVLREE